MKLATLRTHCLSFPDATEQIQWGKDLVFKIGGKMFCVACTEPVEPPKVAMSFKCDDETFAALVERDGAIPAPYMAQHKWVALEQFDTLPDAELRPLIARAYEIVKAKLAGKSGASPRAAKARKAARPVKARTTTTPRKATKTRKAIKTRTAPKASKPVKTRKTVKAKKAGRSRF